MEKTDVFFFVETDDWSSVSTAFRALKKNLKADTGTWTIVGPKGEKLERHGYDLGTKILAKPAEFTALGSALLAHSTSGRVLVWSSSALLVAEHALWSSQSARLWPNAPVVAFERELLERWTASDWPQALAWLDHRATMLPENQVKSMSFEEYEETHRTSFHWPFSPHLIILEQKKR